jgi:hypothetical protein
MSLPKGGRCAEIGVWKGEFSRRILALTRPRELHLIDPWAFRSDCPNRWYGGSVAKGQSDMDRIYESVVATVGSAATVHRGGSTEVLATMPDGHLDWVYVDGDHSYGAVRDDLELSRRKVRPGGILAGDDYDWPEVRRAVNQFLEEHGLSARLFGSQFRIQT